MTWAEFLPNLLIGLREGLEAGLIVTVLVSAVRRAEPERSLAAVWAGVAAAVTVSLSLGAVLTFTSASLSSHAQAVFGGALSVFAVVLVTWMVFWMRRAARTMSGELRTKVGSALAVGSAALVLTAFFAVAREGLETALFVWTNAQAAGSNAVPVLGAVAGLGLAFAICLAMYRSLVRVNLTKFFRVTGAILLVIAAGVLAYGLGDLQEAGVLPGHSSTAFDLTAHLPANAWWLEGIRGVTALTPRMSWLQVIAYVVYLALALTLFLRTRRAAAGQPRFTPQTTTPLPDDPLPDEPVADGPVAGWRRRGQLIGVMVVVVPVALAVGLVVANGGAQPSAADATTPIAITATTCAQDWAAPPAGSATFTVTNDSGHPVDVELTAADSGDLVAEIEVLGPGTTRNLEASLAQADYRWNCVYDGRPSVASAVQQVSGTTTVATVTVPRVTQADMTPTVREYRRYVRATLVVLQHQTQQLQVALAAGDRSAAQHAWIRAHMTYHLIGAAYNAFGDAGSAVDRLAQGLPRRVHDPAFVGFHRIEYGLWGNESTASLLPPAIALARAIDTLAAKLPSFTFDPNDISLRTHEILEGTSRFQLTGQDDYGSGTSLATAYADARGTQALVRLLRPMLDRQSPGVAATASAQLRHLLALLSASRDQGSWVPVTDLFRSTRQHLNASTSEVLETLSVVPDLLEIRAQP